MSKNLFPNIRLDGATIVEHQDSPVEGKVLGGEVKDDLSIAIKWRQHGGGDRSTVFSLTSWKLEHQGNVISLRRSGPNTARFDVPPQYVNLYTLTLPS